MLCNPICVFNPYLPSGFVHPYQLDESISKLRGDWCTFSFLFYFDYKFLKANSENPDQKRRSASNLDLHCLPRSLKWDARLIWVKRRDCGCSCCLSQVN